jgi:hypothetical protein
MTKKDYEVLADVIGKGVAKAHEGYSKEQIIDGIVDDLSYELARDNPRFDEEKFRKAIFE